MKKNIQINFLCHYIDRSDFVIKTLKELIKIDDNLKNNIIVNICCSYNISKNFEECLNELKKTVNCNLNIYNNNTIKNYLEKINDCIKSECEYSCCIDEDIFVPYYTWNYILENINLLEDSKTLLLSPLISNGIPSVEFFIEDFFEPIEKKYIYELFCKTIIPNNIWGCNYESLNKIRNKWDGSFYADVNNIDHYYKGIHPVRISYECQKYICDIICNNKDRFLNNSKKMYVEKHKLPYFCNSIFFIKTKIWEKIIKDKNLYRDDFDEIPLNLYREKNNLYIGFIRNSLSIHMAYNTIGNHNQKIIESLYIKAL